MTSGAVLVVATVILGAGTYAFRATGPLLRTRVALAPEVQALMGVGSVTLLGALVVTTALFDGHGFSGAARTAGVAAGGALALLRAPFVVVVLAAAAVAAGLRAAGVP